MTIPSTYLATHTGLADRLDEPAGFVRILLVGAAYAVYLAIIGI